MVTCRLYIFLLTEMIEDWTVNYKPDLLTFVPYEWSFNIVLRDFEMVWLGNQHNWIECTSNRQDNGMMHTIDFFWKIVIVLLQSSSMIAHIRFIYIILTCKTPFLPVASSLEVPEGGLLGTCFLYFTYFMIDITLFFCCLVELAFCGEVFDLTFVLQYFRFIPEIEEIKFFLQVG